MRVKPVGITVGDCYNPENETEVKALTAEHFIVYAARVSNPANQDSHETAPKLIKTLIKRGHWSPFEMASWAVEIETSRGSRPRFFVTAASPSRSSASGTPNP